jgi:hypothetical protein
LNSAHDVGAGDTGRLLPNQFILGERIATTPVVLEGLAVGALTLPARRFDRRFTRKGVRSGALSKRGSGLGDPPDEPALIDATGYIRAVIETTPVLCQLPAMRVCK